jgi:hypothetical protein
MTGTIKRYVLSAYPAEFQGEGVFPLEPSPSLGSCRHWRVETPAGHLCLRRWQRGKPKLERLQFMQALLWHVVCEGIEFIPLPLETGEHKGFVEYDGSYWELLPWIEGIDENNEDFSDEHPTEWQAYRIISAMTSLAQFHIAASSFPLPDFPLSTSESAKHELTLWNGWFSGHFSELFQGISTVLGSSKQPRLHRLAETGTAFLNRISSWSGGVTSLNQAVRLGVAVQPVIGNAVERHLRFDDNGLCGMIDLKCLCVDNVALDIASLLGSMTHPNSTLWLLGLNAYQRERIITENEMLLIHTFYQTQPLLEGLGYLADVFLEGRPYSDMQLFEINRRLENCCLQKTMERKIA